ncbi:hypothetical protein Tco_0029902, partial [Tanacetum coccineum]
VINGDNHTSKPPLATYCLRGEPSAIRDLDTREPAHSRINIDSEPVVMSLSSTILPILILQMLFVLICHSLHVCLCIAAVTFSFNKGDVPFALDNIQAPSARVTNPEHDHVVHERSTVSVPTSTDARCSAHRRLRTHSLQLHSVYTFVYSRCLPLFF